MIACCLYTSSLSLNDRINALSFSVSLFSFCYFYLISFFSYLISFVSFEIDFNFFLFEDAKFMAYFYFTQFFFFPFFIGMAGLNYWLGFSGYHKNFKNTSRKSLKEGEETQLKQLAEKLHLAMQKEQFYKDPELSLNTLAEKLEVKPYILSR